MRTRTQMWSSCAILSLLLLAATPTVSAQPSPWYFKVDAGGNITENVDVERFFGPVSPGTEMDLDAGFRFGLVVGYQSTSWFALEFETGTQENFVNSITDAEDVDAFFGNVPLMVNAKFRLPNQTRFTPYIGGGAGGAFTFFDIDHIDFNGASVSGWDSAAVFAYQGFAGLRYAFADNMGLGVEYRCVRSQGADLDGIEFGDVTAHVFSLAFDMSF